MYESFDSGNNARAGKVTTVDQSINSRKIMVQNAYSKISSPASASGKK